MRAVVLRAFGSPEMLAASEVSDPVAGPSQVVIDVEYVNITFVETQIRSGRPPDPAMRPDLPVIPGNGVGGVVIEVGEGADPSWIGARVITSTGGSGAYAERVAVGADGLIAVPDELDMADAVALLADGRTAMLVVRAAGLAAGDVVFVAAAGGGVGTLLVQLAHRAGARVIAGAGDDRKLDTARKLGADTAVNYRDPGWTDRVQAAVGGVDVVFDGVGGTVGTATVDLLHDGGRFVRFGMASGAFTTVPDAAIARGVAVVPLPQLAAGQLRDLTRAALGEAATGRLHAVIGQRYSLADAARAHAAIESRTTIGKTLLMARGETA